MKKASRHKSWHAAPQGSQDSEQQTKHDLVSAISDAIHQNQLSQSEAATLLGIPQPAISALMNQRVEGFSVQRLFRILNALGRDVVIQIGDKRTHSSVGKTTVSAA